jgi:SAM-dependent methyltransferase
VQTRTERLLQHIDRSGLGLEIGPAFAPIAPKRGGFKVKTLDHMSGPDLRKKYAGHGVDVNIIEDVDYVWKGERFVDLVGEKTKFDWIIASHVIEHTPCLITFLNECEQLLKPGGVLSLAVPDKRYCFDVFREKTGLAKVIDAFEDKRKVHSVGTAAESQLYAAANNGGIAWAPHNVFTNVHFMHGLPTVREYMEAARHKTEFVDMHSWVFTCSSFRLLIHDLGLLGYTSLRQKGYFEPQGCEFIIALSPDGAGAMETRLELASMSRMEN